MVAEVGEADRALEGDSVNWDAVRVDYDAGMAQSNIEARHGITHSALNWHIKTALWPPRRKSSVIDRPMIITRMFRVLERQVMDLEMEMADMTKRATRSGDREVVLLGKLAGTLDKLMDLDGRAGEGRRTKTRTKEMKDIHHKLIERIEQLKRA